MPRPTIISFLNYKGGVGKTNVAVNFSYHSAVERGLRTLLIDWDPQGDSTRYLLGKRDVESTMFQLLIDDSPLDPARGVLETPHANLSLIGANPSLKNVENLVARNEETYDLFRETVRFYAEHYDLVVLDCPPANSHVNISSIFASTDVVAVTTPASDSLDKISLLAKMIDDISSVIRDNASPGRAETISFPRLTGIILAKVRENTIGLDVARQYLLGEWAKQYIEHNIPEVQAASYSVSANTPVLITNSRDKIAARYRSAFEEVLKRVQ